MKYKSALDQLFAWLSETNGGNPIVINATQELARLRALEEAAREYIYHMQNGSRRKLADALDELDKKDEAK
jgi:hypothetical protein